MIELIIGVIFVVLIYYYIMSFFKTSSSSPSHPPTTSTSTTQTAPKFSPSSYSRPSSTPNFTAIRDKFETIEEVQETLRQAGLESSNLILGIDYTKSNEYNGRKTFSGRSLHDVSRPDVPNPYQQCMKIVARTLEPFDEDHLIPCYGFGDVTTKDRAVFPFFPDFRPCQGLSEALQRYNEITPNVALSGPTSFAPMIYEAIRVVRERREYHILVIIADGQVTSEKETIDAIVEASRYPLSIILVGVGDGPWDMMNEFDDGLPARKFDNFQFVNFNETIARGGQSPEVAFAIAALMEIPEQFKAIRKLGLFNKS